MTVLVAARNEEASIEACLNALSQQDYQGLHIVVVNDRSDDATGKRARAWRDRIPNLDVVEVTRTILHCPKKNALATGVERATGEIVLTTDADCTPPSTWVSDTVACFGPDVGAVIGPAPLTGEGFLDGLLAVQALVVSAIAAGSAGLGAPVTCSGRNFAFRRKAFDNVGGYSPIGDRVGGDDVFLMLAIASHPDWRVVFNSTSPVPSPAHTDRLLGRQLRYQSKTLHAGGLTLISAFVVYIFHVALLVALFAAWFQPEWLPVVLSLAIVKLASDGLFLFRAAHRLPRTATLAWFPLVEVISIPYIALISAIGAVRSSTWT